MAKTTPVEFVREVKREVAKVTWPTRREAMITTAMVFVLAGIMSIFFFLVDEALSFGIRTLLGIGG